MKYEGWQYLDTMCYVRKILIAIRLMPEQIAIGEDRRS